jgi:hypothetical protein
MLRSKEDDIELLKKERDVLMNRLTGPSEESDRPKALLQPFSDSYAAEIGEILENGSVMNVFPKVVEYIQGGWAFGESLPADAVGYLVGNDIIAKQGGKGSVYDFTEKGKIFLREYYRRTLK